jgi:RimJ/RimL family protein N-acetyltransferase
MSESGEQIMIRQLTDADWKAFRQIRLESLQTAPEAFAATAQDWEKLSEEEVRRTLAGMAAAFVAFEDSEPAGIKCLVRQRPSKKAHRGALIYAYVRESLRGAGVAKALHAAVKEYAHHVGIRQIEISVTVENAGATEFWKRLGYNEVGRVPGGFLHDGREIDEVVMAIRT